VLVGLVLKESFQISSSQVEAAMIYRVIMEGHRLNYYSSVTVTSVTIALSILVQHFSSFLILTLMMI